MAENLNAQLAKTSCYCLNEKGEGAWRNLFMGDNTRPLRSDADEQLLLQLGFMQTVKLTQIQIGLPGNSSNPKTVKIFANVSNLDFNSATDTPPVQTFNIEEGMKKVVINLPVVKFQRVDYLTIFIEDNFGEEFTEFHSIAIYGNPIMGTDVSKIGQTG